MTNKSEIDELYLRLMGTCPQKPGTAYEIISSAILSLLTGGEGKHNVFMNGASGTRYQLDGLIDGKVMVEAKDYTIQAKKVGRGDLQKMQGGLTDLPDIEKGFFTSATEFTSPAEKYADASAKNNMQKEIIPATIRKSIPSDLENRIKTFIINITIVEPDYNKGKYQVVFAEGEQKRLVSDLLSDGKNSCDFRLRYFYHKDGKYHSSISDLSLSQPLQFELDSDITEVTGRFDIDAYVSIESRLYSIKGLDYTVPIIRTTEEFTVSVDGTPEILVECKSLGINKLFTDAQLKTAIKAVLPPPGSN